MKRIFALIVGAGSLFAYTQSNAQLSPYAADALLFSQYQISGTARAIGLANAQTALGADLGSIWLNPAGLGLFNRNEISVSPSLRFSTSDALYQGELGYNNYANFTLPNLGAAIHWKEANSGSNGLLGGTLGISYQQLANFGNRYNYQGNNGTYTALEGIEEDYNQFIETDETLLGNETYLLREYYYYDESGNKQSALTPYYTASEDDPARQQASQKRSGNLSSLSIAYGGNFNDKIYFGAGLNLLSASYTRSLLFSETYQPNDEVTGIDIYKDQSLRGAGVNLSLGLIFRPVEQLRLGLSYQSPSMISFEEDYSTNLGVTYNNFTINSGEPNSLYLDEEPGQLSLNGTRFSPQGAVEGFYEFQLKTPGRLNAGLAYFIGKMGFITADIEYLDYSNARLSDDNNFLNADNQEIQSEYQSAVNYRLGTEWRYDIFRFRAGFAYQSDPYSQQDGLDRYVQSVSAGLGLRFKHTYADLGILRQQQTEYVVPYRYEQAGPVAAIELGLTQAVLTMGLNF